MPTEPPSILTTYNVTWYIAELIDLNRKMNSITRSNIGELIAMCIKRAPDEIEWIFNMLKHYFPELRDDIEKYGVLI